MILDLRCVVDELDINDIFDERRLLDDVLQDIEEFYDQEATSLRILFDSISTEEQKTLPISALIKNQLYKDVYPITFGNSGFFKKKKKIFFLYILY